MLIKRKIKRFKQKKAVFGLRYHWEEETPIDSQTKALWDKLKPREKENPPKFLFYKPQYDETLKKLVFVQF